MKNKRHLFHVTVFFLIAISSLVFLTAGSFMPTAKAGEASPELIAQGRELFNKKNGLHTKFACILCHKKDKAIKKSVVDKLDDAQLASVINLHITKKAKGTMTLPADSPEMKALIAFIRYEHAVSG